ncbi:hypothetical protein HK099_002728 [Clydaea vesicula]|uniref:proline--tRNA ligase n=1 Tax=Clydaea vesicula TaxID=447962 RepID=A0AAD5U2D6_9FUNG|nr:hypothetical protein HK099_002728 [Clydaea vesicula]
MSKIHRNLISKAFIPRQLELATENKNVSLTLLTKAGFLRQGSAGIYSLLPLGLRVLKKIENIIDFELAAIDCQKLSLPTLQTSKAWKKTKRWENQEMYKIKDRKNAEFCLAPTAEEEITTLVSDNVFSHRDLPLRLYQIGTKYRDELRPRGGLLRGKEFLMKDLYTFDVDEKNAMQTYEDVTTAYDKIFKKIGIPFVKAEADTGNIGGSRSHEYHYLSDDNELKLLKIELFRDKINKEKIILVLLRIDQEVNKLKLEKFLNHDVIDGNLKSLRKQVENELLETIFKNEPNSVNFLIDYGVKDLVDVAIKSSLNFVSHFGDFRDSKDGDVCINCTKKAEAVNDSSSNRLKKIKGIEIAHSFFLGKKYSSALGATYADIKNDQQVIEMGCFGIGVSRLISAVVECSNDSKGLKWPISISPYLFHLIVIGDKQSKDSESISEPNCKPELIYDKLNLKYQNEIFYDDRRNLNFGAKFKDSLLLGIPYTLIFNEKKFLESSDDKNNKESDFLIEIHERFSEEKFFVNFNQLLEFFQNRINI